MCLLDNNVNMDLGKRTRIDDLECSMFEPPSKRSCPSPFRLSQAVRKRFLKAYTHVPEKAMGTVSLFGRIFPALVALLTGELSFHQYKVSLVMKVEMTKGDGKRKVQQPYFASKPYTILSQHDIENAVDKGHQAIDAQMDKWTGRLRLGCDSCSLLIREHFKIYSSERKFVHGAPKIPEKEGGHH